MAPIRIVYLILAIAGTILPWIQFAGWFSENGWDMAAMVDAWTVNQAANGLVYDLTVSWVALLIWVGYESFTRGPWWHLPVIIVASTGIGVSCGLPLYLFLRSAPALVKT
ncbi:MAG: DUF2834 domain-containing protein [Pseudomonadota bacterium]